MADKKDNGNSDKNPEPKDLKSSVYALHAKGVSPADNAIEHDLDSTEVLAILEEVQASNRK